MFSTDSVSKEYCDALISGLDASGGDFQKISEFLLDLGDQYKCKSHGKFLFEILISGSTPLLSTSTLRSGRTQPCILTATDEETLNRYEQVGINSVLLQVN